MKKIVGMLKRKLKLISFLSIVFLIVFVNVNRVNADFMDEETVENRKERQILDRVAAIKKAFPNQIDEEALYATISHRGNFTDYVDESYDPGFDEDSYKNEWDNLADNISNLFSNIGDSIMLIGDAILSGAECIASGGNDSDGNDYETDCVLTKMIEKTVDRLNSGNEGSVVSVADVKQPKAMDLLTAATIVMLDSSHWTGSYSDENYKKALAGNYFVGNMFEQGSDSQNLASIIMNGVFCAVGGTADVVISTFNPGINFGDNGDFGVQENAIVGKLSRYYTMSNICKYGFIGGTYDHVKNPDLSTEEGKERYQKKKDVVAQEIIDLAKIYRGDDEEICVYYGSTGNYSSWKQTDSKWSSVAVGPSTVGKIGCTTTSIAIQIARSGTKITNLPDDYEEFNPGALATSLSNNGGYDSSGGITWSGFDEIAPNVRFQGVQSFVSSDEGEIAAKMSDVLSTPVEGNYQPFVVLQMYHNNQQHWVAVQGIENNKVIINDPARNGTSLSENYSGESWRIVAYRVMYATDVSFGSEFSDGSAQGGSYSDACETETSGDIVIPEEFGNGGFTVTYYLNSDNEWNWAYNSNQGNLYYNHWIPAGAQFDNGIAVYEDRYLIACTEKFGKVGDKVDFFLEDGTKIPCIIADIKNPNDPGYNEWGHKNGQQIVEFEASRETFMKYGDNPGNNGWFPEWAGKRVSSASNLGENVLGI